MPAEPSSPEPSSGFAPLGVAPRFVEALAAESIVEPTAIQALAIPPLLEGRDLLGQARTGTGKTAAFALPMLQKLDPERAEVQAVVFAPTRELAIQVARACRTYAGRSVRVATIYGGQSYTPQIKQLRRGAQVVVGTPGRLIDLLEQGALSFAGVDYAVLDEADEMLRMGFIDDIEKLLGHIPSDRPRQIALFSATMPKEVRRIADKHLSDPFDARVKGDEATVPAVVQQALLTRQSEKLDVLDRLLEVEQPTQALVFVRTRADTAEVADALEQRGHAVGCLHGDLSQAAREQALGRFRAGRSKVLVATDVAARGLDVDDITHVFNYDLPNDFDSYVHRIGRTGRAGRDGVAIALVKPGERGKLRALERHTGATIERRTWPTAAELVERRASNLRTAIAEAVAEEELEPYLAQIDVLVEAGLDPRVLAAAAARLAAGEQGLDVHPDPEPAPERRPRDRDRGDRHRASAAEATFVISAGFRQGVRPQDVVGLFCNGLGLPAGAVGHIDISARSTSVAVAAEHVRAIDKLQQVILRGRPTPIRLDARPSPGRGPRGGGHSRGRPSGKKKNPNARRPSARRRRSKH